MFETIAMFRFSSFGIIKSNKYVSRDRGQKWTGSALGDLEYMDGVFSQEEISKKEKWFVGRPICDIGFGLFGMRGVLTVERCYCISGS